MEEEAVRPRLLKGSTSYNITIICAIGGGGGARSVGVRPRTCRVRRRSKEEERGLRSEE